MSQRCGIEVFYYANILCFLITYNNFNIFLVKTERNNHPFFAKTERNNCPFFAKTERNNCPFFAKSERNQKIFGNLRINFH